MTDRKEYMKVYRETHKDQIKESNKKYYHTPQGKKLRMISVWKRYGLKLYGYTYDEVYEYYSSINNCEVCNVKLNTNTNTKNQKCMDHCHVSGCFRFVLCRTCNSNDSWMNRI